MNSYSFRAIVSYLSNQTTLNSLNFLYEDKAASFRCASDDLKRRPFSMNNEIELVGNVIFQGVKNRAMVLIMVHLLDQQQQAVSLHI
jgi:hypothetical protein